MHILWKVHALSALLRLKGVEDVKTCESCVHLHHAVVVERPAMVVENFLPKNRRLFVLLRHFGYCVKPEARIADG